MSFASVLGPKITSGVRPLDLWICGLELVTVWIDVVVGFATGWGALADRFVDVVLVIWFET